MSHKPTPWLIAAVEYMIRARRPMTIAEVYASVPGGESETLAGKRLYGACANGYIVADRSGNITVFEATGKRYPDTFSGPSWAMANKMPRVASVFHLAQGVYA